MLHRFLFACLLMCCFGTAALATDDATLAGEWSSISSDGVLTQLHFEANGKFKLRERHSKDLRRAYLCGAYAVDGNVVDLTIQLRKERTADGIVEQASGEQRAELVIQSRTANSLVVIIDSRTVVLNRAG